MCVCQAGNDFGEDFDELQYVMAQVMIIKLKVEEPKIIFDPLFKEIRDIILRCFSEIIASGDGLTRVSCGLCVLGIFFFFTALKYIRTIRKNVKKILDYTSDLYSLKQITAKITSWSSRCKRFQL